MRGLLGCAIVLLALAAYAAQVSLYWTHAPYDDAYITLRYAENLASGEGPVFNPGERVEGYTNFLWMLLLAGAERAGADLPRTAVALGVACGGLALLALLGWRDRRAAVVAILLAAATHALAFHSVTGLETPLMALLVSLALVVWRRDDGRPTWLLSTVLLAALLTRPEAVLLCAVLLGISALRLGREVLRPGPLLPCLALGGVVAVLLAARWAYYGDLLPNTFYAKRASTAQDLATALPYLRGAAVEGPWGLALAAGLLLLWRRREILLAAATLGLLAAWLGFILLTGGDHFPHQRFLVPLLPVAALCTAVACGVAVDLVRAAARLPGAVRGTAVLWLPAAVAALFGALFCLPALSRSDVVNLVYEAQEGKWGFVGRRLRERVPAGTTIAISPAGALPYYSGLRTIDILGLTDHHIARVAADPALDRKGHQKHDGGYVIERRPDLLILNNVMVVTGARSERPLWRAYFRVPPGRPPLPGDPFTLEKTLAQPWERDIVGHPRLRDLYEPALLPLGGDASLFVWRLRER